MQAAEPKESAEVELASGTLQVNTMSGCCCSSALLTIFHNLHLMPAGCSQAA